MQTRVLWTGSYDVDLLTADRGLFRGFGRRQYDPSTTGDMGGLCNLF